MPHAEDVQYSLMERDYVDKISSAYDFASRSLLNLIVTELKLVDRLRFGDTGNIITRTYLF